jgi:putative component of membrane protein insertase Oxa1/YidC/SpoIIIJ protein YidD
MCFSITMITQHHKVFVILSKTNLPTTQLDSSASCGYEPKCSKLTLQPQNTHNDTSGSSMQNVHHNASS